jgi:hypothetical protein
MFENHTEALACDKSISQLKNELGWNKNNGDEFHFKNNSDRVRNLFLQTVMPYNFFWYSIVINKQKLRSIDRNIKLFRNSEAFYHYACGLVFENAREKLLNAHVKIDKTGGTDFRNRLVKYLKHQMNPTQEKIKTVKMECSKSNNLLQLADYVAGITNRFMEGKKDAEKYRKVISLREISMEVWPRK